MRSYAEFVTPNSRISQRDSLTIRVGWIALATATWLWLKPTIFPTPLDVLATLPKLWFDGGLSDAIQSSLWTNVKALVLSTAIALPLAYLSRIAVVRPIAIAVSQLRFLSPAVFFLILLFALGTASNVKVGMLVLGETFFLVTSMTNIVQGIPDSSFDEARVLRMSEWTAMWYITIRGTLADALEAIRDNAAIGWSMLMMVEGALRSEGGVGVMLLNQERYLKFDAVYGIALTVLIVGIGQDLLLRWVRGEVCPHTKL